MNIFEQEDLIKGLPDEALMKEAQQVKFLSIWLFLRYSAGRICESGSLNRTKSNLREQLKIKYLAVLLLWVNLIP